MIFIAALILAMPAQAQGGCSQISDCPERYLPAPIQASAAQRQSIQTALAGLSNSQQKERKAAASLNTKYESIRDLMKKGYRDNHLPGWAVDRLVTDEKVRVAAQADPEYIALQNNLRAAVVQNINAHNAVIVQAAIAYNLTPPTGDLRGDARAPAVNAIGVPWFPHYSRREKFENGQWRTRRPDELLDEARKNGAVGGGVMAARTRGNGVMEFYEQAFSTPEDLAIFIYHETSHWVDIAGKSGGFAGSDPPGVLFRSEQHAYERSASFARQLGVSATELDATARQFKLQAEQAESENLKWDQVSTRHPKWIGTDRSGLLGVTPASPELPSDDETLLRQKFAEASKQVDRQRREREENEDMLRNRASPIHIPPSTPEEERHGAVVVTPGRPGSGPTYASKPDASPFVRAVAVLACQQSREMTDDLLSLIGPGMDVSGAANQRQGLSGCALDVFDAMVNLIRAPAGGPVASNAWLKARVAASQPPVVMPSEPSRETYQRYRDCFRNGDPFGCQPR